MKNPHLPKGKAHRGHHSSGEPSGNPASPDQILGIERTDSNGRFSIVWKVSAGLAEKDFDIYAVFDGDSLHKRARSYNQEMSVLKTGGSITLNPFPTSAEIGDTIIFSGNFEIKSH